MSFRFFPQKQPPRASPFHLALFCSPAARPEIHCATLPTFAQPLHTQTRPCTASATQQPARASPHALRRPPLLHSTACERRSRPLRLPPPFQDALLQERLQIKGPLPFRVQSRSQQRARTTATVGRRMVAQRCCPRRDPRAGPRLHTGDEVQRYALICSRPSR